jgi:hypothetical protein
MASPAQWQWLLITSAWIAAAALGGLLFNAYHRRVRATQWATLAVLALSIIICSSAVAGVTSYGLAANVNAVIVSRHSVLRSVPTEADTTQKTSPLSAGSIALADKTFLGWRRLSFENGQTGWVRKDDIVPLWK